MKSFLLLCLVFFYGVSFGQYNPEKKPVYGGLDTVNTAWDSIFVGNITAKDIAVHHVSGSGNLIVAMENDTLVPALVLTPGVANTYRGQKVRWIRTKSTSGDVIRNISVTIDRYVS